MDCSICFDAITEATGRTILGCKHEFHLKCVVTWLQMGAGCPYCRAAMGEYETLRKASPSSIEDMMAELEEEYGMTALMVAARNNECDEIQILLEAGTELEDLDVENQTALCYAVMYSSEEAATLLLENGASLAPLAELTVERSDGSLGFALLGCCCYVSISCLTRLLADGADPNFTSPRSGLTPLMEVAQSGCCDSVMVEAIRLLLAAGADVSREDRDDCTALLLYERDGRANPVIQELLTPAPVPRRSPRLAGVCIP
jgi:ankyrin repeat protein